MLNLDPDLLGKPGEGFHKERLFGFARNDLVGTVLIAILISYLGNWNVFVVFGILMLIAIYAHWLFRVNTTLNVAIFGEQEH